MNSPVHIRLKRVRYRQDLVLLPKLYKHRLNDVLGFIHITQKSKGIQAQRIVIRMEQALKMGLITLTNPFDKLLFGYLHG